MSKYVSLKQLKEAVDKLRPHHSIFSSTFWVMKKAKISIGTTTDIKLNSLNDNFLRKNYKIHPDSEWLFRIFRSKADINNDWIRPDYAGKGLQSVNTRFTGTKPFIHLKNSASWGFSQDYVDALSEKLPKKKKLPLFLIAAWFYRDVRFRDTITREEVVQQFIKEFNINKTELSKLFDSEITSSLSEEEAFCEIPFNVDGFLSNYSSPVDAPPEKSGFLRLLEAEGTGPLRQFSFIPEKRLNIITGDNSLGKTFILDLAWYVLTRDWAELPAQPSSKSNVSTIKFITGKLQKKPNQLCFSQITNSWNIVAENSSSKIVSGLTIYSRIDDSFAIHDPASSVNNGVLKFSKKEIIDGNPFSEGLIRDWVSWQTRKDKQEIFETFGAVLACLFSPDMGELTIGSPVRLLGEKRELPTLNHPYDTVPFPYESAGIKKIIMLAYVIVWAWEEHKIHARERGLTLEKQMILLMDEVESHLHPKWQRIILPAIEKVALKLSVNNDISIQFIVTTHSPLVLASSEPIFNQKTDKLFHLDIANKEVIFDEIPFNARGTVDSWLSSDIFEIKHPGNKEREAVILEAIRLQEEPDPKLSKLQAIHERLKQQLEAEDPFWVRWLFFAECKGVVL
jgi:hypothetical protein